MSELFPRAASFIPISAPNKFLPILRGVRASIQGLPPTAYVDSESEATQLLLQSFGSSPPIGCSYSNISIAPTSGWYPYPSAPTFLKEWVVSYTQACVRDGQTYVVNSSTPALMGGVVGCPNVDDEIRSLLPDTKFYTPFDSIACVSRIRVDRPQCCDGASFGYGPMTAGNPINFGLGRKVLIETDYVAPADSRLTLQRYYEVHATTPYVPSNVGRDWVHSFNRALFDAGNPAPGVYSIGISEPNGHWTWFTQAGSGFVSMYHPADTLTRVELGAGAFEWRRHQINDDFETYDSDGRNTRIETRTGRSIALTYDIAGRIDSVTSELGRKISFTYGANGRLSRADLPDGSAVSYDYSPGNLLTAVHYQGGATKTYTYNPSSLLSTITDENANSYLSVTYNYYGKATGSSLAGGVNNYAYSPAYASGGPVQYGNEGGTGSFTLMNPVGAAISIGTVNVNGSIRPASVSQPCASCGISDATMTYDANGNLSSRVDFNGKKVCYAYDLTRNLETARVEGILSSEACGTALSMLPLRADVRKISTQWHPLWRLPTRIAEPNRVTTNAYNGDGGVFCAPTTAVVNGNPIGVLCRKSVQATTDGTGQQGLSAMVTGAPRAWQYTYDAFGQVLSATDPNNRTTTSVYYAATDLDPGKRGNVQTITNPVGHVTTFTAYDLNGRPTSIIDPNGTVITLTYHPRGWLTSRTLGGETTTYDYDAAGQLTKITQPDGTYVAYTYDSAHRLTQVQDGLGNKIVYTLDAIGNRIKERVYDPSGQLARVKQQVFDSVNRLHQSVGAQ